MSSNVSLLTSDLAMVFAEAEQDHYPNIYLATHSILFLATPHGGSKTADFGLLLVHIARLTLQRPAKHLLEALQQNSVPLVTLSRQFRPLVDSIRVVSFYERQVTPLVGTLVRKTGRRKCFYTLITYRLLMKSRLCLMFPMNTLYLLRQPIAEYANLPELHIPYSPLYSPR